VGVGALGFVKTKIRVSSPDEPSRYAQLELSTDTKANFTLIPRETIEQIGAVADTRFKLRIANGKLIEREGSTVWIEVDGKGYRVPVIVGEEGDVPVLGVTTLEIPGLEVDPVTKKLKPADYLLLRVAQEVIF
jgi:aspartyl protease family protein